MYKKRIQPIILLKTFKNSFEKPNQHIKILIHILFVFISYKR